MKTRGFLLGALLFWGPAGFAMAANTDSDSASYREAFRRVRALAQKPEMVPATLPLVGGVVVAQNGRLLRFLTASELQRIQHFGRTAGVAYKILIRTSVGMAAVGLILIVDGVVATVNEISRNPSPPPLAHVLFEHLGRRADLAFNLFHEATFPSARAATLTDYFTSSWEGYTEFLKLEEPQAGVYMSLDPKLVAITVEIARSWQALEEGAKSE